MQEACVAAFSVDGTDFLNQENLPNNLKLLKFEYNACRINPHVYRLVLIFYQILKLKFLHTDKPSCDPVV